MHPLVCDLNQYTVITSHLSKLLNGKHNNTQKFLRVGDIISTRLDNPMTSFATSYTCVNDSKRKKTYTDEGLTMAQWINKSSLEQQTCGSMLIVSVMGKLGISS